MRLIAGLVMGAGVLVAASTAASEPAPDAATAELVISKNIVSNPLQTGAQAFNVFDGTCDKRTAWVNFVGGPDTRKDRKVKVTPGQHIYVEATTQNMGFLDASECSGRDGFIPEAGHRYSVEQGTTTNGSCPIQILDMATDQAPPGIQYDVKDCRSYITPDVKPAG